MGSSALNKQLFLAFRKSGGKMLNYLPVYSTMQNASVGTGTRSTPAGRIKNRRILICIHEVVLTYINTAYLVQVI